MYNDNQLIAAAEKSSFSSSVGTRLLLLEQALKKSQEKISYLELDVERLQEDVRELNRHNSRY